MLWPFATSARTKSKPFLAKPEFWKLQLGKEKHKVHVLIKILWPFTTSAHVPAHFWLQFLSSDGEPSCTFSCQFLNENHELSRSHLRQIDLRRQCLHSCDLLPCWLRSKDAGVAY